MQSFDICINKVTEIGYSYQEDEAVKLTIQASDWDYADALAGGLAKLMEVDQPPGGRIYFVGNACNKED